MPAHYRHAHILGLGGIGTSALAQWLRADGWHVSGSDRTASEITSALAPLGIEMTEEGVWPDATTLLVYSDAVPATHPVRQLAYARGVRQRSYAELLGELTTGFRTIAIAGSHGKSTTTALAGLILEAAGIDPTVVVGTRVPQWERRVARNEQRDMQSSPGNFRRGSSNLAVVEADEYRRHFLTLTPTVAIVTSVDYDHVDAFPTPTEYEAAYGEFVSRVKPGGTLVIPAADPAAGKLRTHFSPGTRVLTFAVGGEPTAASVVTSIPEFDGSVQTFRVWVNGVAWGTFAVSVPGVHVVANAAAAIAAAVRFDVTPDVVRQTLAEFRGTWRRFERVGEVNGAPVISDYAHHPTELTALYLAARQQFPDRRIVLAFQPHQRARTRVFAEQFLRALQDFDVVVLAEVYDVAGREDPAQEVSTRDWVLPLRESGKTVTYAPVPEEVTHMLQRTVQPADVVLIVGAGDIDRVARQLARVGVAPGRGDDIVRTG